MKPTLLALLFVVVTLLGTPAALRAQGPRVSPSGVVPLARTHAADSDLRVPPVDLHELSEYVGWGGTIGGALGITYALAFEHGPARGVMIMWDGLVGFTCGIVAGAAVYIVKAVVESR